MEQPSVIHDTFVIERSYPASPERVFRAFSDPAMKRRWFVDSRGHQVEQFEMDFRVGGNECSRLRFKEGTPVAGLPCLTDTYYHDIVPNRRLVFTTAMAIGGRQISVALATVELLSSDAGTDLVFTHQAAFFEGADGPEMRRAGWQTLLERLAAEQAAPEHE
jgi:uncharacterized protein YndB with AHSA1/START domain